MNRKATTTKKKKTTSSASSKEFKELADALESSKRILISTHELPDGDGLGAQFALYSYLKRARKACRVYNPDRIPKRYQFMDPKKQVLLGPGEVEIWDTFDLWVIVDTNDPRRLGKLWPELSLRARKIIFLDHHPNIPGTNLDIQYPPHATMVCDVQSSSIGELLYRLFDELELTQINSDIALGLYVSVMTDTNSFRYSRTTPLAHKIAGEMIETGVNPEEVYQSIYSSKELSHLKLLGVILQNVKVAAGGKLAWLEVDADLRHKHRATADDTQSFLNILLLLKDAEVVCFFRQEDDQYVRVSIKSKGRVIVNRVAMELGGGGHDFAAGLAVRASLKKAVETITGELEKAIDHYDRFKK